MEKDNKIKLTDVKTLGDSKFEVSFRENGTAKKLIITENRHWIADINDYISNITSENPGFYEVWGHSDFRTQVCRQIKKLSKKSEMQIV